MKNIQLVILMSLLLISSIVSADHEIKTEISINASPKAVWKVLSDWQAYPQWNPFIINISGEQKIANKISANLKLESKDPMEITPILLNVEEEREIRWKGKFLFTGLFDGEHYFLIEPTEDGKVTFIQGESFSGILFYPIWHFIGKETMKGFEEMNAALKLEVENQNNISPMGKI